MLNDGHKFRPGKMATMFCYSYFYGDALYLHCYEVRQEKRKAESDIDDMTVGNLRIESIWSELLIVRWNTLRLPSNIRLFSTFNRISVFNSIELFN